MVVENFLSISHIPKHLLLKSLSSFALGDQVLDCPDFASDNLLVLGFDGVAGCTAVQALILGLGKLVLVHTVDCCVG